MPAKTIRIGVVDSGVGPGQVLADSAAFVVRDGALWKEEADPDRLGHGSRVAEVITKLAPEKSLRRWAKPNLVDFVGWCPRCSA